MAVTRYIHRVTCVSAESGISTDIPIPNIGELAFADDTLVLWKWDGSAWTAVETGRLLSRTLVTAGTTTYTTPAYCRKILAKLVGAGGGGGGASGSASNISLGGGGGAGGYAEKVFVVAASTGYTVAVGTGGAGGVAAANGSPGSAATTLTVGATTVTANVGQGGIYLATGNTTTFALGGAGATISTNGDLNAGGQPGMWGHRESGSIGISGMGASSIWSGGGQALTATNTGNAAVGIGAGGGGAMTTSNTTRNGGAGGNGLIVVYEFV